MARPELDDSIKEIRAEAQSMLKNIGKVRGKKYATAVQTLLLIKQVAEISSMLCNIVAEDQGELADACADGLKKSLFDIGVSLPILTDYDNEEWKQIVGDVDALSNSVSHLMKSAVSSYIGGRGFGGLND